MRRSLVRSAGGAGGHRRLTWRSPAPRSVVDRLVDGGPEVVPHRQSLVAHVRPLHDDDRDHVLGGIVVPGGAVEAGPSVAPDRGAEVRAAGADPHSRNPSPWCRSTPARTRRPPSAPGSSGRWSSASPTAARAPARRDGYRPRAEPPRYVARAGGLRGVGMAC